MEELNDKLKFKDYINNISNFIISNYKQLLLFLLTFIIIYVVDCITYHNALIYNSISLPNIGIQNQPIKNEKIKGIKNKRYKK